MEKLIGIVIKSFDESHFENHTANYIKTILCIELSLSIYTDFTHLVKITNSFCLY